VIAAAIVTRIVGTAGRIAAIVWIESVAPIRTIPRRSAFSAASLRPGRTAAERIAGRRPTISPRMIATVTSEIAFRGRSPVRRRATAARAIAMSRPGP
jgi:hypothetical protein